MAILDFRKQRSRPFFCAEAAPAGLGERWGIDNRQAAWYQECAQSQRAMMRPCTNDEFEPIREIINDAAKAYRGVIPADRWHEPYMSRDELRRQIDEGVVFWGYEQDGRLLGVMGIQQVGDVTLIRHAYVRTAWRRQGIGGKLLAHLRRRTARPVLIGTWASAAWAIAFYQKHGFRLVCPEEKDRLLAKYWCIPGRQIETSVVLADRRWRQYKKRAGPTEPAPSRKGTGHGEHRGGNRTG